MIDARHALLDFGRIALVVTGSCEEAPGFVEQHPRKHRRRIVVAIDHATQGDVVLMEGGGIWWTAPVRDLGHAQHTEPVGPVEFAWGFDLDVLAQAGQSDLAGAQDFFAQRAIRGERVVARRMIGLIECQLQKDGRAVDRDIGITGARKIHDGDRAHPEVGMDDGLGEAPPGRSDADHDVLQERILQGPAVRVRKRDVEVRRRSAARDPLRHHRLAVAIGERESQRQIAGRRLEEPHVDAHSGQVVMRREVHGLQGIRPARFEVHGLPHASCSAVALLAFELERMRGVVHTNHQTLWLARRCRLQLERKRSVAALVLAQFCAVEPDRGAPIAGAEHQEHALPPVVPGRGHGDLAGAGQVTAHPTCALAFIARIERESPPAVQVQPLGSLEVGPRMLRQRDGRNLCSQRPGEERQKRKGWGVAVHATPILQHSNGLRDNGQNPLHPISYYAYRLISRKEGGGASMEVIVQRDYAAMSKVAAQIVAELLNTKPNAVLGMATGSTPLGLYQELVRLHKKEQLDFSRVTTFNLDEYVGLNVNDPQSYHYFMHEHFFRHVNIPPQNINIPSGTTSNYPAFCAWYEKRITECGGIDLQILGIGTDGHIAFNEPTSSLSSRTRLKTLSKQTIDDNARFFERRDSVPVYAITMGVGTILDARKLVLVASGRTKAKAIAQAVEGPVTSMVTASALQLHRDAIVIVDQDAASGLTQREYYEFIYAAKPAAPRA